MLKNLKIFLLLILSVSFCFADTNIEAWKKDELNEFYMKRLNKDQCMYKSIAMLNNGCASEQCLTNISAITGDCLSDSRGTMPAFCEYFDRNHASQCIDNKVSANTCWFIMNINRFSCTSKKFN